MMRGPVALTVAAILALGACSNAAAPTRTAAPASLPQEQPSGGGPFPTVGTAHDDPSLEALLPSTFNGVTLVKTSTDATQELSQDAAGQAVAAFLASQGKKPADLKIAEAFDPDGNAGITVVLFRAPGVDAAALRQSMILAGLFVPKTATPPPNLPAVSTVGGKEVIVIPFPGSGTEFLYARGDVLYDVRSGDPDVAARMLTTLP